MSFRGNQVVLPAKEDVLIFLGWVATPENLALADAHITYATDVVGNYTRGVGFDDSGTMCDRAISNVIKSAAARSLTNPSGAYQVQAGSLTSTPARFGDGLTIAEQVILDEYRVRVI